jgi:hypothetical protein
MRFGIGVTSTGIGELFSAVARGGTAPTIYLPIRTSSHFRIEPELGIGRFSTDREMSGSGAAGRKQSSKTFNIGVGLFGIASKGKADLYYGGRLGYIRSTTAFEFNNSGFSSKDEESRSGYFAGPAVGIEYWVSDHFSMGGEAQVNYSKLSGEEKESGAGRMPETTDVSSSSTATSMLIFVRFYF